MAALAAVLLPAGAHAAGAAAVPDDPDPTVTDHLLGADQLPTVGGRTWSAEADGAEDQVLVGRCQKSALETLGAVDTAWSSFSAEGGFTAAQVVGEFADARSAWRVEQVLVAWREDCEDRVAHARVGRLRDIAVTNGTGTSYRGAFASDRSTAGLAILRTGRHLVLVEVSSPTDRYPTRWDPARVAVRRVARTF